MLIVKSSCQQMYVLNYLKLMNYNLSFDVFPPSVVKDFCHLVKHIHNIVLLSIQ